MRSFVEGLGHDANILDAGLAHGVYNKSEGAKRNRLIAPEKDCLSLRIMHLGVDLVTQFMDVDGVVANINALRAIDRNDHARFGNFLDRLGLGHVHFDAGLQDRRRDHEDHEEDEHDVHEGDDVDLGKGGAGLSR